MSEVFHTAIRLDADDVTQLRAVLEADGGAYMVVRETCEDGRNVHFHGVLISKRKSTAVRAAIKRAMPQLNGNGSYSCVPVRDLDKYHRYMLKGKSRSTGPEIVCANGIQYTEESWRDEQHDAYWDENEEINRTRKKKRVFDAVLDQCKEAGLEWTNREAIAKKYIKELSDRNMAINLFSVKSHCNLIQVKLCPDDRAIEDLAGHIGY